MIYVLAALFICLATLFADSKTLALQICLDRAGYSCNTIDGVWGRKGRRALQRYVRDHAINPGEPVPTDPNEAYDRYFAGQEKLFRIETVTEADLKSLVSIPTEPAARARLDRMGYETVKEMFAERGHVSQTALERMNPGVVWDRVQPGLKLVIPDFPSAEEELSVWPKGRPGAPERPEAALVRISLSNFEVTVFDAKGKLLALFPCSIARDKAKLPSKGELRITTPIARPNYTYTPDYTPAGQKVRRYVWPEGPNCPIGIVWLGLNLPGYGIHGTVRPESIGNCESHGCFRLANWNAARLYAMVKAGTRVLIDP